MAAPDREAIARRKASARGTLDTSLPATLRRRAKDLSSEYNDTFLNAILEAADRIEVYERAIRDGMAAEELIALVGDNRRMRKAVTAAMNRISTLPIEKALRKMILQQLYNSVAATASFGADIRILSVTVGRQDRPLARALVEGEVAKMLDQFYGEGDDAEKATTRESEVDGRAAGGEG
jgi:hypothetical protein